MDIKYIAEIVAGTLIFGIALATIYLIFVAMGA